MKKILFIAMAALCTAMSFGQTFTVSGTVTLDYSPVPAANVVVKGTSTGTQTDFDGKYSIELEQGEYTLVFSGYEIQVERPINLSKDIVVDVQLGKEIESLDEVLVSSVRVKADSPITHSNLDAEQLAERNLGQDIATQLNFLPNVVTTSDAGAGIGYTGFRVRGTGNQGINVTINGIPYNDAESATTFFVNLQDFTSSVESLQLQRGVGSSTNGPGAFGASLNILTDAIATEANAEVAASVGSFGTRRNNVKFSTGLLNDHIEVSGRLSNIQSDGYIDRASSDLKSYFLQAAYKDDNTLIKLINFAGSEVTYQSWFGIDAETLAKDRTFNPAGQFTDEDGETRFHNNQVDDYKQDHYQLHWNQRYNNNWSSQISLNYTYGRGFFEEYREDETLDFYNITGPIINGEQVTQSDLIRRRWLDNDFYVANATVNYKDDKLDVVSGLFYSTYTGDHFGEVIWSRFAGDSEIGDRYYFGVGDKREFSTFAKGTYRLDNNFSFYLDLQGRFVNYETTGQNSDVANFIIDEDYSFFNPKAGASYKFNNSNQLYASFARAHREPNRTDFENGAPRPERLDDFELGYRFGTDKVKLNVNGYYMFYKDQLVLTGALDISGAPIRANSGESYRLGLEIDADISLSEKFSVRPNIGISRNQNNNFINSFTQTVDGEVLTIVENLGKTEISYSPSIVAGSIFTYKPAKDLQLSLLSKYVGEQFMSNIESDVSRLDAFFVNDFNISYEIKNIPVFKSIIINGLVNNIFDTRYVSNGYFFAFDDDFSVPGEVNTVEGAGFYPQAGINFLIGTTLKF